MEGMQPTMDQSYYGYPQLASEKSSILDSLLDNSGALLDLEMKLRGMVLDPQTNKWETRRTPLMNDEGINLIMTIVEGRIGKHTILSNLDEEGVNTILLDLLNTIIPVMALENEKLGIDINNLSIIRGLIDDVVYFSLRRAMNKGERDFIQKIFAEKRVESMITRDGESPERRGGLKSLFKL